MEEISYKTACRNVFQNAFKKINNNGENIGIS